MFSDKIKYGLVNTKVDLADTICEEEQLKDFEGEKCTDLLDTKFIDDQLQACEG